MNRRAFFATLAAGLAAAADPERLLWVPGKKLISIPKPAPLEGSIDPDWDSITVRDDYYPRGSMWVRRRAYFAPQGKLISADPEVLLPFRPFVALGEERDRPFKMDVRLVSELHQISPGDLDARINRQVIGYGAWREPAHRLRRETESK